jgi:hypothetical protein
MFQVRAIPSFFDNDCSANISGTPHVSYTVLSRKMFSIIWKIYAIPNAILCVCVYALPMFVIFS